MHTLNTGTHTIVGTWDAIYARYLQDILSWGDSFEGRNGLTRSLFGVSVVVDLKIGFPLTQLRKMPIQNLFREFLFDIGFDQNVEALGPARHFWDFLADENGELGASAYNRQWRMWPPSNSSLAVPNEQLESDTTVDQLQQVITRLRETPNSRQATVITHNPTAINPACPPCHLAMQFSPRVNGELDLMVPARSNDMIVGFPLDIARYAIITHVVAKAVGMEAGRVYMPSANSHIYENCFGIAEELIHRKAKSSCHLMISPDWNHSDPFPLNALKREHLGIYGYDPEPAIKVEVN